MENIIIGVISGIMTSFVVGVFLMWKGESIISHLKHLPYKWRVKLVTKIYLSALNEPPNIFTNSIKIAVFISILSVPIGISIVLYNKVLLQGSPFSDSTIKMMMTDNFIFNNTEMFFLFAIFFMTLFLLFSMYKLSIEAVTPYCSMQFEKIERCVLKCASDDEYLKFINLLSSCKSTNDLIECFKFAKDCLNGNTLDQLDEIIDSLNEKKSIPVLVK